MNKKTNTLNETFNSVSWKLNFFAFIIFLALVIPGAIVFFYLLNQEEVGYAFLVLLLSIAIASFFSTLLEALAQIVLFCQQIEKNTNPNKKIIQTKTVKYKCKKCGNLIDSLPCPICNKLEQRNNSLPNTFCNACGADISNDLNKCHVCGTDIK